MRPCGSSVATKISLRFSSPKRDEIERQVVPVRHDEADARDGVDRVEHGLAHRVQRVLDRLAAMFRERVEHRPPDRVPRRVRNRSSHVAVLPRRGQRRGQQPVARFRQRGVLVPREAGEGRVRGLQDHQVRGAGRHGGVPLRSADTTAVRVSGPRRMKACPCSRSPRGRRLHRCSARSMVTRVSRSLCCEEVPRQPQAERFGLLHRLAAPPARRRCSSSCRSAGRRCCRPPCTMRRSLPRSGRRRSDPADRRWSDRRSTCTSRTRSLPYDE